jgi:sugar lactone lactonase YvrE
MAHRSPPFTVTLGDLNWVGSGLHRPECVLCTAGGDVYVSDWRGGVSHLRPDGSVAQIGCAATEEAAPARPNGIALQRDGSFLLADIERGGVYRLTRDGALQPFLVEAEGRPLPATNFVMLDRDGGVWVTVSTRLQPRQQAYRAGVADGFIVRRDRRGTRIVADGLGFTNECHLHPSGRWLYVNETFGRRLSRYPLGAAGSLGGRETVTEFGHGTYPDGLAFDVEGGAWITSVVSNRVIRVLPDGSQQLVLEDSDPAHVEAVERAYQAGTMTREHLSTIRSSALKSLSSLAFGGPDRRTAYLGCLLGDRLATFRAPVAGAELSHWHVAA